MSDPFANDEDQQEILDQRANAKREYQQTLHRPPNRIGLLDVRVQRP
jgi:hypothetical protein